jgi:hypothetical protein
MDNQETLAALGWRQSRDTGNIGMKTNKHVTQKTKATSNTDQQSGMKPGVCEG